MLDFTFSEEHEMLRSAVREFARNGLAPGLKERQRTHEFSVELRKQMADVGLCALNIPEEYEGLLSDTVSFGIAVEELGRVDTSAIWYCFNPWVQSGFIGLASEEVKQEWLPAVARGEKLVGMGATEAEAGSDLGNLSTSVRKDGDYYILNGEKNSVSHGTEVDAVTVLAKFDVDSRRTITPFLVPVDAPGVTVSPIEDMGTMIGGDRAIVSLEDVRIPAKYLLGDEAGKGFHSTMRTYDATRAVLALGSLGNAQTSLDETCEYVKQRVAFGKPIAKFEGVSFSLAEMATDIELGRWLAYRTCWMRDQGMVHSKEAAMLHWWVGEKAHRIHHNCLLLHGHYGFSKDLPFEARMRDSYVGLLGEAPVNIMKIIISRELLGKGFLPY